MSKRMSRRSLLEALRRLMASPEVVMRRGRLRKEHGLAVYDRDPATDKLIGIKITVDSRNAAIITITIHELLHVYLAKHHNIDRLFSEPLEEAMVKALAEDLGEYLHDTKNARLFQSWVSAVEAKLK